MINFAVHFQQVVALNASLIISFLYSAGKILFLIQLFSRHFSVVIWQPLTYISEEEATAKPKTQTKSKGSMSKIHDTDTLLEKTIATT